MIFFTNPKIGQILFTLLFTQISFGQDAAEKLRKLHSAEKDQYFGLTKMNDIEFKKYQNFQSWNFITTRYRQDSHELRFTYANDMAMKALKEGSVDYPDGSVYVKMGYLTEEDQAFPSSLVPSGAKRYQIMVRDKKKYKDTDGWGYALFNVNGVTFPGQPQEAAQACAACHRVVGHRGYVFSQLIGSEKKLKLQVQKNVDLEPEWSESLRFINLNISQLDEDLAKHFLPKTKELRSVQGDIQKNVFEGTLDEIRPFLEKESLSSGLPAILYNREKKMISYVFKDTDNKPCPEGQNKWKYGVTIASPLVGAKTYFQSAEQILRVGHYCRPPKI